MGATLVRVAEKLVAKCTEVLEEWHWLPVRLSEDDDAIEIIGAHAGMVFFRTTDSGLQTVGAVTNLTALASKAEMKVTLSWALPSPPPAKLYVFRSATLKATLPGAATSFVDEDFEPDKHTGGRSTSYDVLCGDELEGRSMKTGRHESLPVAQICAPMARRTRIMGDVCPILGGFWGRQI